MTYRLMGEIVLRMGSEAERWTVEAFYDLCGRNPDYRLEMTPQGDLVVREPNGSRSAHRNFELAMQFGAWVERDGTGVAFDSSAGFKLPRGGVRAPDLSWIKRERWDRLSPRDQERFAPIAPDFVVEVRSPSDRLTTLQAKMDEYLANGVRLGWLIDPLERRAHVYRPNAMVDLLDDPDSVSGEPELPRLRLNVARIW